MPDQNRIEFVGLDEAYHDMATWASQLGPAVEIKAMVLAGGVASRTAAQVPVLSGALAASVNVAATSTGVDVSLGAGLPYAGWIEFGGSRGRPLVPEGRYLYPTALAAESDFIELAEDVANDTARRFPWS